MCGLSNVYYVDEEQEHTVVISTYSAKPSNHLEVIWKLSRFDRSKSAIIEFLFGAKDSDLLKISLYCLLSTSF